MTRSVAVIVIVVVVAISGCVADEAAVDAVFDFADPFVVNDPDSAAFVAFATNNEHGNVPVATSNDVDRGYVVVGDALPALPAWAQADSGLTWAPAVLRSEGNFVLYYTARDIESGFQCIGRALSETLRGPYVDSFAGPMICQVDGNEPYCGSIDPSPFLDAGGGRFLLWKSDENAAECQGESRIWAQRLAQNGVDLVGERRAILRQTEDWEAPLIEGPSMRRVDGQLLLFYSANDWYTADYAIGFAVCEGVLGPCDKQSDDAPWLENAYGPGGQDFVVDDDGRLFMSMHMWSTRDGEAGGGVRGLVVDEFAVDR